MEELDFNKMNLMVNSITETSPGPQSHENSQSSESEKQFPNIPKQDQSKGVIEMPKTIKISKIQKSLDNFIQNCLNKYKPLEHPDPSLYTNTAENEKDLIISKKSTIPDLVIWNKTFNKNDCFIDANPEVQSDFPRYRFYLRLGNKDKGGKNKNEKNKNKEKKNKKNKKDKKIKPNDELKNKFAERLKMMQGGNIAKKDKKEEPKKININEKLKQFGANEQPKKEEKVKEKEKPKNPFLEKINKLNSHEVAKKEDTSKKPGKLNLGGSFTSKLNQMNELFKKQAEGGGLKLRTSAMIPSLKMGFGQPAPENIKSSASSNLGIINEEPDKMKPGYDPSSNLQQTLDSVVVVQKNKKKKKRPSVF